MAKLRFRLRFNPGRDGTPLDKLGEFAIQTEKFLRSFAADLGVSIDKGEWIANDFKNESVSYNAEYARPVNQSITEAGLIAIDALTGPDPIGACSRGAFGYTTLAEFSRIGKTMDPDEKFFIGLYVNDASNEPLWHEVPFRKTAEIRQFLEVPFVTYGSVQGILHSWFPGPVPPFIQIREINSAELVKCICTAAQYKLIHESTGEPRTLLNVYGDIEWDRGDNSIVQIDVSNIEPARQLTADEFDSIFGSMPNITADLSTSEYIARLRGDNEHGN